MADITIVNGLINQQTSLGGTILYNGHVLQVQQFPGQSMRSSNESVIVTWILSAYYSTLPFYGPK